MPQINCLVFLRDKSILFKTVLNLKKKQLNFTKKLAIELLSEIEKLHHF